MMAIESQLESSPQIKNSKIWGSMWLVSVNVGVCVCVCPPFAGETPKKLSWNSATRERERSEWKTSKQLPSSFVSVINYNGYEPAEGKKNGNTVDKVLSPVTTE